MPPESGSERDRGLDDASRLQAGALALGLVLSVDQVARLLRYREALLRWNRVYNLTALRDPEQVLVQHLMDCLAAVPALRRHAEVCAPSGSARAPLQVLDVGSGGGLPGVVLALLQPDWSITCVDTVAKKCAFIRQMAGELALERLTVAHNRVESLRGPDEGAPGWDVVVCRAFSSLADFASLTRPLLRPAGVWLAMKGQRPDAEISELPGDIDVFHVEPLQVPGLDHQRHLVWMRPRQPFNPTPSRPPP